MDMEKEESSGIFFDPEGNIDMEKEESSGILFDPEGKMDMDVEKEESSGIMSDPEGKIDTEKEESSGILFDPEGGVQVSLAQVVADCEKSWFKEIYRLARAGNKYNQVLLGQMYTCGYGVDKDLGKAQRWNSRGLTANLRSGAALPGGKRPGYGASESDSEEDDHEAGQDLMQFQEY